MNEFIVWDKKRKRFMGDGEVVFSDYGDLRVVASPNSQDYIGDSTHNYYDESRWTFHNYIGRTDIEGNKIYADSSIVEFDIGTGGEYITKRGYFFWNEERLNYMIMTTDEREAFDFKSYYLNTMKVIGTLQENKELL